MTNLYSPGIYFRRKSSRTILKKSNPSGEEIGNDVMWPPSIANAAYDGVSFFVGGQQPLPSGLVFSNTGDKFYVIGGGNDSIYQYSMTEGFDISTASYDGVRFDAGAQDSTPRDFVFNSDGSKIYVVGQSTRRIIQYTLSAPFDMSTVSYDGVSFGVGGQELSPYSMAFSDDGNKFFVVGTSDIVYQYSLSSSYDMSTASYDGISFNIGGQEATAHNVTFNKGGDKFYIVGSTSDTIYQYSLSAPFNLTTASFDGISFSVVGQEVNPYSLKFNNDGSKFFVVGIQNDTIYQYTTSSWQ